MNLAFQFVDLLVVAVIVISAVYATYRGLVSESLSIIGWVAAAYAALYLGPYCAGWMRTMIQPYWLGEVVGFVVVFLVVLLPLHFAASRITANVKRSDVGTLDSVLGTGFGILRGIAVVGIAFIIFMMIFPGRPPEWITAARLYPLIYASAEIVVSVTPLDNPKVDGAPLRKSKTQPDGLLPPRTGKPPASIKELLQDRPFRKTEARPEDENSAADSPQSIPNLIAPERQTEPKTAHKAASKSHTVKKTAKAAETTKKDQIAADKNEDKAEDAVSPNKQGQHAKKTYGAKDRHALDRLIETSHGDESGKP